MMPRPPDVALPRLQDLAGPTHKPSPLMPWQLLQLLVAYCAVMRQFNGEPDAEGGWEAAHQLLQLAPPLIQAALVPAASTKKGASSKGADGSSRNLLWPPSQAAQQEQQEAQTQTQQQDKQQQAAASILSPDSVRGACIQLFDAAAAAQPDLSTDTPLDQQLLASAEAVSGGGCAGRTVGAERRALLQVAMADAVKLLQLGRPAAVLALTDARRQLQDTSDRISEHLRHHQKQQHQESSTAAAGGGRTTHHQEDEKLQRQRQRYQLQQLRHYLRLAVQKLWYLAVWSNEQPAGVYQGLADAWQREVAGQQAMVQPVAAGEVLITPLLSAARATKGGYSSSGVQVVQPAAKPVVEVVEVPGEDEVGVVPPPPPLDVGGGGLYDLD